MTMVDWQVTIIVIVQNYSLEKSIDLIPNYPKGVKHQLLSGDQQKKCSSYLFHNNILTVIFQYV